MPTKNAEAPKKVAPKRMKKPRRKIDNTILMFDSHLMPLPTPDSADKVDAPIMTNNATTIPNVVAEPSSRARPPIPIRVKPATNCSTPKPSVCATPRIVATTATMSMIWPSVPERDLPNSGVSDDRMVRGSPLR